nr:Trk system potassium transporter TrkA [Conchiformibius kuhniae]
MKILILGGGQVGSAIAQELATMPGHDITVIDTDEHTLKTLGIQFDVQTITGNGASPVSLERAGAADADMLLALTRSDETNLVACKIAAAMFNVPNRIARVRSADYLGNTAENALPEALGAFDVTDSIHPEELVTEHLSGLLNYVRALQVLPFAHERVQMIIAQAKSRDALIGKNIADIHSLLPEHTDCQICAIYRNNRLIVPQAATVVEEGDEICFAADSRHVSAVMGVLFHYEQKPRRVMIAGGGNIGFRLARQLEERFNIKIIELNPNRAEWLAERLDHALVLQGSASDENLLAREYIDEIDIFCALTNDDENNIMSGLLAKNLGAKRVICIINRSRYVDLITGNQIDIVVSPHMITIGSILAHVRRGDIAAVYPLRRGTAEAIEVVVHGDRRTSLVGRRIDEIKWYAGCHIAAIVRGDNVMMGRNHHETVAEGDHLILFVARRRILRELEKLIQVKMGFFG